MKLLYMRRPVLSPTQSTRNQEIFCRGVDELVRSDENEHLAG